MYCNCVLHSANYNNVCNNNSNYCQRDGKYKFRYLFNNSNYCQRDGKYKFRYLFSSEVHKVTNLEYIYI